MTTDRIEALRAWLDEKECAEPEELEAMRKAFEAGVHRAAIDALWFCGIFKVPPPIWLVDALCDQFVMDTKQNRQDAIRRKRWGAVLRAKIGGLSWVKSYEAAHEALKGTDARGEPATMKDAYQDVQRDMRTGNRVKHLYRPWSVEE
jgi:hypothetical protein